MEYTVEELCDAFAKMIPIAKGPGELVYVMSHSISADSNQITHEFQLSDGGMITLTTTTKEEQPTKEEIINELVKLAEDLYVQGYYASIDSKGKWYKAYAVAMSKIAHGEKYNEDMVIRIYNDLYPEEDKT